MNGLFCWYVSIVKIRAINLPDTQQHFPVKIVQFVYGLAIRQNDITVKVNLRGF